MFSLVKVLSWNTGAYSVTDEVLLKQEKKLYACKKGTENTANSANSEFDSSFWI